MRVKTTKTEQNLYQVNSRLKLDSCSFGYGCLLFQKSNSHMGVVALKCMYNTGCFFGLLYLGNNHMCFNAWGRGMDLKEKTVTGD